MKDAINMLVYRLREGRYIAVGQFIADTEIDEARRAALIASQTR